MYATQEEFDALVRAYNTEVERIERIAARLPEHVLARELVSLREMFEFVLRTHNANRVTFHLPVRLVNDVAEIRHAS